MIRPAGDDRQSKSDATRRILGTSAAMELVRQDVTLVAPTGIFVCILGPSGGGKELVARAIHEASGRPGAFVPFNCAELTEALTDSILRGHEKGAFTGAIGHYKGLFEQAMDGTLFLDEVGEFPLSAQPKALRLLEASEFTPVGGSRPVAQRARVICATHRNLAERVLERTFRHDLHERIAQYTISVPSLADRAGDIPELVEAFLAEAANEGIGRTMATPAAIMLLRSHEWPGNVRQLRHAVRGLALRCNGREIRREDVIARLGVTISGCDWITRVLHCCGGNVTKAAGVIGIARETLHRQMQKLGIPRGTGRAGR